MGWLFLDLEELYLMRSVLLDGIRYGELGERKGSTHQGPNVSNFNKPSSHHPPHASLRRLFTTASVPASRARSVRDNCSRNFQNLRALVPFPSGRWNP